MAMYAFVVLFPVLFFFHSVSALKLTTALGRNQAQPVNPVNFFFFFF